MARPFLPNELVKEKNARIRFTKNEFEFLEKFAINQGVTFSTLVRTALKFYISANNPLKKRRMGFQDDVIG
jgi:hypothetical protein